MVVVGSNICATGSCAVVSAGGNEASGLYCAGRKVEQGPLRA